MTKEQAPLVEISDLAWIPPGAEQPLWDGVSFALERGELVILEGQSGSGKSTLLRCIVALEELADGAVRWRGEVVDEQNIRLFRNRVLYVHQSPVPIADRVGENLSFPRRVQREFDDYADLAMSEEEQRQLLDRFGLENIDLTRRFDELSVGEQQRVALVRCFTIQPEVLLLDEPTASLDDENAGFVEDYVTTFLQQDPDRAVIWISHDRQQRERLGGRVLDMADFM